MIGIGQEEEAEGTERHSKALLRSPNELGGGMWEEEGESLDVDQLGAIAGI